MIKTQNNSNGEQKTLNGEKSPIILGSLQEYDKKIKNAKNSINYSKFLIASLIPILIFAIVGMTGVIPGVTLAKSAMIGIFCGVGIFSNFYEISYNKVKIEDLEKGKKEFSKQQRSIQQGIGLDQNRGDQSGSMDRILPKSLTEKWAEKIEKSRELDGFKGINR